MLISEVAAAEETSDGNYLIEVADHKTDYIFGPAQIVLTPKDFGMLKDYIEKARPQVSPSVPNVFLSYSGNKMTGGDVSKRLHVLWKRSNIFEGKTLPKNLCVNTVRKSANIGIRETMFVTLCVTARKRLMNITGSGRGKKPLFLEQKPYVVTFLEKTSQKEKAVTRKDDYKMLITDDQVYQYMEGDNACLAKSVQKKLKDKSYGISQKDYCALN